MASPAPRWFSVVLLFAVLCCSSPKTRLGSDDSGDGGCKSGRLDVGKKLRNIFFVKAQQTQDSDRTRGGSDEDGVEPILEGATFKRAHRGGGVTAVTATTHHYVDHSSPTTVYYEEGGTDYIQDVGEGEHLFDDTEYYSDHYTDSSKLEGGSIFRPSSGNRHHIIKPLLPRYSSVGLFNRYHRPPSSGYHPRPLPPTPIFGPSPIHPRPPHYDDGPEFHTMCCADCPDRNIQCLSVCVRTGCNRVETCGSAGDGAYAAFCQSRCKVIMGMSFGAGIDFLPDPACRGHCAGNVQRLCAANSCTDYGCYAPECGKLAPLRCG